MEAFKHWYEQLQQAATELGQPYIDVILDQTGGVWGYPPYALVQRMHPALPWYSLFTGTPEEHLLQQAPLLMRLDLQTWQHKALLQDLFEGWRLESRLMLLLSPLPFEELSARLTALLQMELGGRGGILRFYDPRIFPELLNSILTDEQSAPFRQAASFWGWLDRDGQQHWLRGDCHPDQIGGELPPVLRVSDAQYELLGCISDANQLLDDRRFASLGNSLEQRFAALHALARQKSAANDFGTFPDYVVQQLAKNE